MPIYYNSAFPQNQRDSYSQYSQVDFLIKTQAGREVEAGSMRITGVLNVTKALRANPTTFVAISPNDKIFVNPYAGAHVLIQNASVSVNERTIESIGFYPRPVIMDTMSRNTLEELTACSDSAVEMKGNNGNIIISTQSAPTQTAGLLGAPFRIVPNVAINKSSANIPSSKYPSMKMMLTLSSALNAFYVSIPEPAVPNAADIVALDYTISQLQLHWIERPEAPVQPKEIVFNTNYLTTSSVVSLNTTINVVAPNPYDAVTCSFIQQANRNSLYADANMCEYLRDIDRVEFTLNNQVYGPITYICGSGASPVYQDLALLALKSLNGDPDKNCIVNRILQENGTFLIGMKYAASQSDRLGITMQINSQTTFPYSQYPYDCLLFVNGFAAV
jgi:hypothetical protein